MSVHNGDPEMRREDGDTLRLFEEELVAHKEWREVGEVVVRTEVIEEPDRIEVEASREEIDIEHVPVNQVVDTRESPIQEDDAILIPVYEEQLVVQKRLYLREYLRVRRFATTETRAFSDTVRRERVIIDAPPDQEVMHERFPKPDR